MFGTGFDIGYGPLALDHYEGEDFHNNHRVQKAPKCNLPTFDMHRVEEALLVNHVLYEGKPLTRKQAQEGIRQYRVFLRNHKASGMPERFEVPSYLVDRVWHAHMCETKQYHEDCMQYFGKVLHHASDICNGGGVD